MYPRYEQYIIGWSNSITLCNKWWALSFCNLVVSTFPRTIVSESYRITNNWFPALIYTYELERSWYTPWCKVCVLQYRHWIPAPVDRTSVSAWLYNTLRWYVTEMTHVACGSKLRSVVRSSLHPCPGNWVTIGRAAMYYARAVHAFSAALKCRHCRENI